MDNKKLRSKKIDKISIKVNGHDRYATGLSKTTTIDEIKYAMLSVSDPKFRVEDIDNYGIFEKFQGNERLLDGGQKIYKIINFWKSLPGTPLPEVKFVIKKKKNFKKFFPYNNKIDQSDDYINFLQDIKETSTNYDSDNEVYIDNPYINIKKSLIDLVKKQNELIDSQLKNLSSEQNGSNELEDDLKCKKLRTRIIDSIQLELKQTEKIEYLYDSLKQINEIIELKKEFIRGLENDLREEHNDEFTEIQILCEPKKVEIPVVYSSVSTSSVFTSISTTSIANEENYLIEKKTSNNIQKIKSKNYSDSDMIDSWSISEDSNSTPLETLV
ncbi:unnamed protein product [Brachionus calyciflorus]|uniref:Ras-associating domain-containing protein n=1 Tax=Brachionus calyciflorus TaxID=104777 RepID=A0A813Z7U5_9BILA|nr:unnamed protein product [Brachionus calyciflorus]